MSACVLLLSCSSRKPAEFVSVDKHWLDSIEKKSDTNYVKKYRNEDFVTAQYFINRKDSTVSQIMKDSAGHIRQIIITRKNNRIFTSSYYPNGQLMVQVSFDGYGKFHGPAKYYYENGHLRMEGNYVHGLFSGEWTNYDENGDLASTDQYDENGQLIKKAPIH
jgi:antitoxin component YwqK of YwqJK toxin-antitoxin module